MKKLVLFTLFSIMNWLCNGQSLLVSAINDSDIDYEHKIIELSADSIRQSIGTDFCCVTDNTGNEIVSQFTYDGKFIFPVNVDAHSSAIYNILPSDTLHKYKSVVSGRIYPERADDIAWENENVGFRIYGPQTQAKGEKAFGYDIFFKHPTSELIVERLYAAQNDRRNWQKADSLRKIDRKLADEFINTFTYHVDHGLGYDCYAVGPTLGDGAAALIINDTIRYPWCYERAQILDNGPLRFKVRLDFAPIHPALNTSVTEHRLISLDSGDHLNRCDLWYDGLNETEILVMGFPRRDQSTAFTDLTNGILAYPDPTQGKHNGRAMLGLILTCAADSTNEQDAHILVSTHISPEQKVTYYWGFAWDRTEIQNMDQWKEYLVQHKEQIVNPLRIVISKQ